MPYFLHIFALELNCRTACLGWVGACDLIQKQTDFIHCTMWLQPWPKHLIT